jgi:CRP-like cAMP-binding protein
LNKTLGTGKSFGDLSFALFSENRRYSAVALEESHLATLDKESFISTIGTMRNEILNQAQSLSQNTFFKSDWSKYDLMRIAVNFESHEFKRDNIIYKEGDIAEEIYFLRSGEVENSKKLPDPERELHEIIQENFDPNSPGKIKRLHLSLWTDYTIFGHEEFFEREIARQKNPKEKIDMNQPLKRFTTATVNSNIAEIWSCPAQVSI